MSIQKNIRLSNANLEKFQQFYPEGSLSWILDILLEEFVNQLVKTPRQYAEIAAKTIKEELE